MISYRFSTIVNAINYAENVGNERRLVCARRTAILKLVRTHGSVCVHRPRLCLGAPPLPQ